MPFAEKYAKVFRVFFLGLTEIQKRDAIRISLFCKEMFTILQRNRARVKLNAEGQVAVGGHRPEFSSRECLHLINKAAKL